MITEPIALDKSLNTTDQNSQNLADVMKEGLAGIRNAIGSGNGHTIVDPEGNEMSPEGKLQFTGGVTVTDNPNDGKTVVNISGGHTIIDQSGQTMPTESKMQFADSFVSDDDVNGKTVIENIKEHSTKADYDNATEDGFHVIDDGEDAVIHPSSEDYVEVVADGVKTRGVLLNELFVLIDSSKVTDSSMLDLGGAIFQLSIIQNSEYRFGSLASDSNSNTYLTTVILNASNSKCNRITIDSNASAQYIDITTNKPNNGTKITLYYGNKKAVVDLQTTANRCLMSDGTTVQEALSPSGYITDGLSYTNCTYISGGYIKIGNLVQLSIKVTITTESTSVTDYITLPNSISPSVPVSLISQNTNDDLPPINCSVYAGKIYMKNTTANKMFTISGCWVV